MLGPGAGEATILRHIQYVQFLRFMFAIMPRVSLGRDGIV